MDLNTLDEVYISVDIETDGRIPGFSSMLSLGSAAFLPNKKLVGTFSANLEQLPGVVGDQDTLNWWKKNPEAWKACRENIRPPEVVMNEYLVWIKGLGYKNPVCVAYPVGFDFMFIYWYLIRFTGESPFGHNALDIRSYVSGMMKWGFKKSSKRNMPKGWFGENKHTHVALDDAIEQGELFCNILSDNFKEI